MTDDINREWIECITSNEQSASNTGKRVNEAHASQLAFRAGDDHK